MYAQAKDEKKENIINDVIMQVILPDHISHLTYACSRMEGRNEAGLLSFGAVPTCAYRCAEYATSV